MTDLEITKLCAEAMGYEVAEKVIYQPPEMKPRHYIRCWVQHADSNSGYTLTYRPLYDDAQCMALVKHFGLTVNGKPGGLWATGKPGGLWAVDPDLNHAICECVAKMQAAKVTA